MPYPRICAHRGFNTVAPENSLAALGAAIGMGAVEIEFDVRFTRDGVPVVAHDSHLERVSNGSVGNKIRSKPYFAESGSQRRNSRQIAVHPR